jgi:argininosuccinate lyase
MPQKKNPDTLELVRGRTGDATAGLDGLLTTLKGLPRAYNRDLQRATGHAWDAIDSVTAATTVAIGAVTTAEWPEERLYETADDGFATATGVADLLAQSGVPFRTAHEVVAHAGELAEDPDVATLDEAGEAILGEAITARVPRDELERALDAEANVAMRDSRGGPAPTTLDDHIERATDGVAADRDTLVARREALADAEQLLHSEVDTYV